MRAVPLKGLIGNQRVHLPLRKKKRYTSLVQSPWENSLPQMSSASIPGKAPFSEVGGSLSAGVFFSDEIFRL